MMTEYIKLLVKIIQTPSFSGDEDKVALIIRDFLKKKGIPIGIKHQNTWAKSLFWDDNKPVILLNSHIDTVKPVAGWTGDPFSAELSDDKLIGLGSNDAGASLVTLLAVFISLYQRKNLPYNLIFAASAEEEITGERGMVCLLNELGNIDFAIIGEPTNMQLAIAEKGLLVLDCTSYGKAGHAAREEGENAIYKAIDDINCIKNLELPGISPLLGPVKFIVTQINSGYQHNVIPDKCTFVVDIRTNELYSNQEVLDIVKRVMMSEVTPRSLRLNSSSLPSSHPIIKRTNELNITCFGSPTLSDQSIMPFPSVKIGPGDSARSHTANEYILLKEIYKGFTIYLSLLDDLKLTFNSV